MAQGRGLPVWMDRAVADIVLEIEGSMGLHHGDRVYTQAGMMPKRGIIPMVP